MDMHFFLLNISNLLGGNSDIKCLKSLSCKFPAKESNEPCKIEVNLKILCFY